MTHEINLVSVLNYHSFHLLYLFKFPSSDGLAHSARRLLEQHRIDLLRNITDLLGRTFPSQFVFPVLGHEDGHGNSFDRLGDLWRHWLPSEALQTFEKGTSEMFFYCSFYDSQNQTKQVVITQSSKPNPV